MKTKKPAVKKVTKKQTQKDNKQILKELGLKEKTIIKKSRFADKDFSYFAPNIKRPAGKTHKVKIDDSSVTTFPYEIEGEPAFNCNKWTFMCLLLAIGLMLLATSHGDFLAVAWNLKH